VDDTTGSTIPNLNLLAYRLSAAIHGQSEIGHPSILSRNLFYAEVNDFFPFVLLSSLSFLLSVDLSILPVIKSVVGIPL
jgi:hypothetical protein